MSSIPSVPSSLPLTSVQPLTIPYPESTTSLKKLDLSNHSFSTLHLLKQFLIPTDPQDEIRRNNGSLLKRNLSELILNSVQIGNGQASGTHERSQLVGDLLQFNPISSLQLKSCGLSNQDMEFINDGLTWHKTLKLLDLSQNAILDRGSKSVAKIIRAQPNLETLVVSDTGFGDGGAKHLANALLAHQNIRYLDLSGNDIGDFGCYEIANFIRVNESLVNLDLRGNSSISDAGLKALVRAVELNETLQSLEISVDSTVPKQINYKECLDRYCLQNKMDLENCQLVVEVGRKLAGIQLPTEILGHVLSFFTEHIEGGEDWIVQSILLDIKTVGKICRKDRFSPSILVETCKNLK